MALCVFQMKSQGKMTEPNIHHIELSFCAISAIEFDILVSRKLDNRRQPP